MGSPDGSAAAPEAEGAASPRTWAKAFAVAAAVFLLLEALDAFVAVQLREISSVIVGAGLGALGFPVTREGTILITPNVRFDVVPACSGSTTLRVLLFVVIVWCGIHPRLTLPRRLAAAALAVPLAVLANAVRVSALVVAGHLAGEEPGGFFHGAAGVLAFALAMLGGFGLTDALATDARPRPGGGGRAWAVAQGLLLAFLAAPFAYWCARGWGYALDRFGWVLLALAGAAAVWSARRAPADRSRDGLGTALFAVCLLVLLGATVADVNILKGVALLGALLAAGLAAKGPRFLRAMLPVAAVAYLGFPTTSYQLQVLTIPLFGAGSVAASLGAKAALAALLTGAWFLPVFRPPSGAAPAPAPVSRWSPLRLSLLAALTAFQGYYYSVGASAVELGRLEMSYLQAGWSGRPYDRSALGEEFFQGRVWSRRYARGTEAVDVLVTSTGGDRHRAHPPAYCLTGDGWAVATESRIERRLGDGRTVPMTRMRLRKDGREMDFSFWFTDGADARGTYREMLAEDTVRRLAGRRTDWFLFRVMTESGEASLDRFLGDFRAGIEKTP